jgi:ABC-type bacteriocin/lantibiotic exporter with double-glycine peptidase domain
VPEESLLIPDLPFYPDDTRLCGPASLAAVMNYMGYPVTLEEVEAGVQRWEIKGSIGPDLVLWARSRGARARFFAAEPEELLGFVERRTPVVVQVDEGIGPVIMGHFMVVAGYSPDGIVVNSGTVRQEIRPWAKFLTQWYRMGNFAIEVGGREAAAPAPAEGEPAPGGGGAN